MDIVKLIEIIVTLVLGGGLYKLITWRTQRRKEQNNIAMEEYINFTKALESFQTRMTDKVNRIVELQDENQSLKSNIKEAKALLSDTQKSINRREKEMEAIRKKMLAAQSIATKMKTDCECNTNVLEELECVFSD